MRAYMGITVHWMDETHFEMDMECLDVFRIKGSQTAVNILENVDNCLIRYGIKCKVNRIVSDTAANMKGFLDSTGRSYTPHQC